MFRTFFAPVAATFKAATPVVGEGTTSVVSLVLQDHRGLPAAGSLSRSGTDWILRHTLQVAAR
jgi:hypothetical protein